MSVKMHSGTTGFVELKSEWKVNVIPFLTLVIKTYVRTREAHDPVPVTLWIGVERFIVDDRVVKALHSTIDALNGKRWKFDKRRDVLVLRENNQTLREYMLRDIKARLK